MEGFELTVLAAGSAEACRAVTKLGRPLPTVAPVEANAVATQRWTIEKKKILVIAVMFLNKQPQSTFWQKENPDLGFCEDPTERTVYF